MWIDLVVPAAGCSNVCGAEIERFYGKTEVAVATAAAWRCDGYLRRRMRRCPCYGGGDGGGGGGGGGGGSGGGGNDAEPIRLKICAIIVFGKNNPSPPSAV